MMDVIKGTGWELRLGRFQDALADIERCDAIITDPPYLSASLSNCGQAFKGMTHAGGGTVMGYAPASESLLDDLCAFARSRCKGWFVAFNDFDGAAHLRANFKSHGNVVAEPIAWVKPPALTPTRGALNLPVKGTEFITAARFNPLKRNGRIPGSYVGPNSAVPRDQFVTGGKPLELMRAIVRDFTKPGDLILEPFAGGGTTILAAVMEGRRCIASEMSEENFAISANRLSKGYTTSLFSEVDDCPDAEQTELFAS